MIVLRGILFSLGTLVLTIIVSLAVVGIINIIYKLTSRKAEPAKAASK